MSIDHLLNQEVTLYTKSGYGADGKPSHSTETTIDSRFEKITKRILLPNGQLLTIAAVVMVGSDVSINTDDKITYNSIDYKVVDIEIAVDDLGQTSHKELRVIKWPSA